MSAERLDSGSKGLELPAGARRARADVSARADQRCSPAFIVGMERSGTTLLSAMLNRHSLLCVTPETDFWYVLGSYPGGAEGFLADWPGSARRILGRLHGTKDWPQMADELVGALGAEKLPPRELFVRLGHHIADRYGKRLWIEKTPNHARCLPLIRENFPDAAIIHIVRDGRDVAESLTRVHFGSPSFYENLLEWRRVVSRARRVLNDDSLAMQVLYEDLVGDPESVAASLCEFLGLAFEPGMLSPDGSEDSLTLKSHPHMDGVSAPIDPSNRGRWQERLSPARKRAAWAVAGDELAAWGYRGDPNGDAPAFTVGVAGDLVRRRKRRAHCDAALDAVLGAGPGGRLVVVGRPPRWSTRPPAAVWLYRNTPVHRGAGGRARTLARIAGWAWTLARLRRRGCRMVWLLDTDPHSESEWAMKRWACRIAARLAHVVLVPNGEAARSLKGLVGYRPGCAVVVLEDERHVETLERLFVRHP